MSNLSRMIQATHEGRTVVHAFHIYRQSLLCLTAIIVGNAACIACFCFAIATAMLLQQRLQLLRPRSCRQAMPHARIKTCTADNAEAHVRCCQISMN